MLSSSAWASSLTLSVSGMSGVSIPTTSRVAAIANTPSVKVSPRPNSTLSRSKEPSFLLAIRASESEAEVAQEARLQVLEPDERGLGPVPGVGADADVAAVGHLALEALANLGRRLLAGRADQQVLESALDVEAAALELLGELARVADVGEVDHDLPREVARGALLLAGLLGDGLFGGDLGVVLRQRLVGGPPLVGDRVPALQLDLAGQAHIVHQLAHDALRLADALLV